MPALSNATCLDLWERGCRLHPLDRGLLSLAAGHPETPYDDLADWALGRRNVALAELHCACFGRDLAGQLPCPACAEELEFQMDGQSLTIPAPESAAPVFARGRTFRLPTTRDLASVAHEGDTRSAAIRLVESCRTDATEPRAWQDDELEEIGEQMAAADPMAEVRLAFDCVKCGHHWEENLDIAAYLWVEIEARAKRLLTEIHTLAAAYGWSEQAILALSEPRRRLYLEMVQA